MTKKIAIIGYGWLGQPLASLLINKGHFVAATCRTAEKIGQLKHSESQHSNLSLHQVSLSSEQNDLDQLVLKDFDCVVIAITPVLFN